MIFFFIILIGVFLFMFLFAKPNISERKTRLMNLYSSVLSDMNIDYRDAKIGVQNIRDISESIIYLSKEIQEASKGIIKESVDNQRWLVDLIREFSRELDLWMSRHSSELQIVTENLIDTMDKNPTLDLVTARLQTQIDTIDQARTRI